jgi:trans-aconitate methyltransferase
VLGVDPSPDMIAFASSHFGPPALANLRFELGDARSLKYREEFELAVSFNALHWVPEQGAALGSIHAALKPGGKAQLRLVPSGPRTCLEDVIEETRCAARWAQYFDGFRQPYVHFTPDEYRALAEQAGFAVLELHVEDKAWDFQTREAFVAFARATFVEWTQHLPERERLEFINEVLDRYQAVAADKPQELATFKFYQMEVVLARSAAA